MDTGAMSMLLRQAAIGAYDRESVERFARAARDEKERLHLALASADERRRRAEAATFSGSLEERLDARVRAAQRALAGDRRAVEAEVERILSEAELEAADVVARARDEAERHASTAPSLQPQPTLVAFDADIPMFGRHFTLEAEAG